MSFSRFFCPLNVARHLLTSSAATLEQVCLGYVLMEVGLIKSLLGRSEE